MSADSYLRTAVEDLDMLAHEMERTKRNRYLKEACRLRKWLASETVTDERIHDELMTLFCDWYDEMHTGPAERRAHLKRTFAAGIVRMELVSEYLQEHAAPLFNRVIGNRRVSRLGL
jgi:hypothetical protein